MYRPKVKTRHSSHFILRRKLPRFPFRTVIRFGSTTEVDFDCVEINTVDSVRISSDKKLMKQKFNEAEVRTAVWTSGETIEEVIANLKQLKIKYKIVAKSRNGSRGEGNTLINSEEELINWSKNKNITRYIFEKFHNYGLEYRLHVTKDGYFYACRKALKKDASEDSTWRRHVDNSVWLLETNEEFKKPASWNDIVSDCVKALKGIAADVLSFDVRVQSELDKEGNKRAYQNFILIESNSASSMKAVENNEVSICAQKYIEMLPQLILDKSAKKGDK